MDWKAVLKEDLKRDEGLRLKAYTNALLVCGLTATATRRA